MKLKKQAVTIQDVAKAVGVSVTTVSRALNGKIDIASETQANIMAVIQKLGYTTNLAARSMRSHTKNLIGLVVPDIGLYSTKILRGINKAIAESKFDLMIYTTGNAQKYGAAMHEQRFVSLLANSITDGVIVVASASAEFNVDAPIVAVDPHVINPKYPSVQGMNYQGSLDIMEYLIGLGHRRIGFICGRKDISGAERRLEGYRDAVITAGLELDESLIANGDFTQETAHQSARQLLESARPPTAIFAANDQSAMGVFQAAKELGLRIPEDLSVAGFDNILESKYLGLTTVDQFLGEMGYLAVKMLIKLIDGEPIQLDIHKMRTKLVIRSSCQSIL